MKKLTEIYTDLKEENPIRQIPGAIFSKTMETSKGKVDIQVIGSKGGSNFQRYKVFFDSV